MQIVTRPKTSDEVRTYEIPFGVHPEFDDGAETLASLDSFVVTPAGLTTSGLTVQVGGSSFFFTASGGTVGTRYLATARVITDAGHKLVGSGIISIVDPEMPTV